MIYFLVNNNYHLVDLHSYINTIEKYDLALIQIPHNLTVLEKSTQFKGNYIFSPPLKGWSLINIFQFYSISNKIHTNLINITSSDILIVYTEYELLNQVIIKLFYKKKAKVFLIEDGGLPTYITFSTFENCNFSLFRRLKHLYIKKVLRFTDTRYKCINKLEYAQLPDHYYSGVVLYFDMPIERKIKAYIVKKESISLSDLDENSIIFLNERIYEIYIDYDTYIKELKIIITQLSNAFHTMYFKFHPAESKGMRNKITEIIMQINHNIEIITSNESIELILEDKKSAYVASYISAALLNLYHMGMRPIYLFPYSSKLSTHPMFKSTEIALRKLGYNFPESLNEIKPGLMTGKFECGRGNNDTIAGFFKEIYD